MLRLRKGFSGLPCTETTHAGYSFGGREQQSFGWHTIPAQTPRLLMQNAMRTVANLVYLSLRLHATRFALSFVIFGPIAQQTLRQLAAGPHSQTMRALEGPTFAHGMCAGSAQMFSYIAYN